MTFRGVYRDGIVYLEQAQGLRNGTLVEVTRARKAVKRKAPGTARTKQARPKQGGARSRRAKAELPLPGFGAWKHRTDLTDTAAFARALRRRVGSRSSAT